MSSPTSNNANEAVISALYQALLDSWNRQDAAHFAALFGEDCHVVGFDGSQMDGQAEIESTLSQIFADHKTGAYIAKIRGVSFVSPDVAILRAVSGLVPAGQPDINPATNAIQTLVATRRGDQWRIALFQNTPAQFHGRPEVSAALTSELRDLLVIR
jgi:uncharacterized protein (TIGR02246 family)